jgi:hypothetical protein
VAKLAYAEGLSPSVARHCRFESYLMYHVEDVRLVEDTALKAAGRNRLVGSIPMSSAKYVGSSLEAKASPCEGEEVGALPICHPKLED